MGQQKVRVLLVCARFLAKGFGSYGETVKGRVIFLRLRETVTKGSIFCARLIHFATKGSRICDKDDEGFEFLAR